MSKFHDVTCAERRHQLITGGSGPVGGNWAMGGGWWLAGGRVATASQNNSITTKRSQQVVRSFTMANEQENTVC